MKPTTKFRDQFITPAIAADYLKRNRKNRPINKSHVERLKRDIETGRWVPSPQPIVFDIDGDLIDGQHRLTAIVEGGIAVWATVCEGAARESIRSIDMGQTRKPDGILRMLHGVEPTVKEIAVSNSMSAGLRMTPSALTKQEQAEFFLEHASAIRWAMARLGNVRHARSPAVAVVARATYTVDHAILERFCKVLADGIAERPEDATVIALRDFLMSPTARGGSSSASTYRKTAHALDAFRKGETIGKLYETRVEPFPLKAAPEEQVPALKAV